MLPSLCRVGFCEWAQNTRKLTPIYAFIPAHRSGVLHWESPPFQLGSTRNPPTLLHSPEATTAELLAAASDWRNSPTSGEKDHSPGSVALMSKMPTPAMERICPCGTDRDVPWMLTVFQHCWQLELSHTALPSAADTDWGADTASIWTELTQSSRRVTIHFSYCILYLTFSLFCF